MNKEINWDNVWSNLPAIMGLNLYLNGRKYYGKYRIDGSPHLRRDKLVIQQGLHDKQPIILEQGGEICTLWNWLTKYGHLSKDEIVKRLTNIECKDLQYPNCEYIGDPKYVNYTQFYKQGGMDKRWCGPLFQCLCLLYNKDKVIDAFCKYNVTDGMKHPTHGVIGTRFWYINQKGDICHDKTMFYDISGHRIKDCSPMRMYKRKFGYTAGCFFGEDSIKVGSPVLVVESEKTAIIAYLEYPGYNWVASGGKCCLNKLSTLSKFNVYLVPDADAMDEWAKFGKVWDWVSKVSTDIEVGANWDIADLIIARKNGKCTRDITSSSS